MKQLPREMGVDAIYAIDFESYYDQQLSLKKMPTTEYVTHPGMEIQTVSIRKLGTATAKTYVGADIGPALRKIDWSRNGFLAHHCQFDALIASHHYGVLPKRYFDTLSMAKPIMPVEVGGSLLRICAAFGRAAKKNSSALGNVMGKRLKDFTKAELAHLRTYNGDDADDCIFLFEKLLPHTPISELKLIDMTVRMYAQPTLRFDKKALEKVRDDSIANKEQLMEKIGADRATLMSNDLFAEWLRTHGVEPPMKASKANGKPTYAMAKTDAEFKKLLEHDNEIIAAAVAARLGVKSTILETRAQRMIDRVRIGAQPVYLNYWGAKTGRWSGGDKMNWQNFSRGSGLRTAIAAPPGHELVIADLSQIEARLVAWFAGQANIIQAFAEGKDVYAVAASGVYGRHIDKDVDKLERFVGKVMVLALGYGAGWNRFAEMLRIGAFGPPIPISDAEAKKIHSAWRRANPHIVASWKRAENNAKSAFFGMQVIDDGVLSYQGKSTCGITLLPNGTYIRYDGIRADEQGMAYVAKARRLASGELRELVQRLYGGLIVENNTQALARIVIAEDMIAIEDELPYWRTAMSTHDEVVGVVPIKQAAKALAAAKKIMSTSPVWAPDLPVAVDAHRSKKYDK